MFNRSFIEKLQKSPYFEVKIPKRPENHSVSHKNMNESLVFEEKNMRKAQFLKSFIEQPQKSPYFKVKTRKRPENHSVSHKSNNESFDFEEKNMKKAEFLKAFENYRLLEQMVKRKLESLTKKEQILDSKLDNLSKLERKYLESLNSNAKKPENLKKSEKIPNENNMDFKKIALIVKMQRIFKEIIKIQRILRNKDLKIVKDVRDYEVLLRNSVNNQEKRYKSARFLVFLNKNKTFLSFYAFFLKPILKSFEFGIESKENPGIFQEKGLLDGIIERIMHEIMVFDYKFLTISRTLAKRPFFIRISQKNLKLSFKTMDLCMISLDFMKKATSQYENTGFTIKSLDKKENSIEIHIISADPIEIPMKKETTIETTKENTALIKKIQWKALNRIYKGFFLLYFPKKSLFLECRLRSLKNHEKKAIFIEKHKLERKVLKRITIKPREIEKIGLEDEKIETFLIKSLNLQSSDFFKEKKIRENNEFLSEKRVFCINNGSRVMIKGFYRENEGVFVIQDNSLKRNTWKIPIKAEIKDKNTVLKEIMKELVFIEDLKPSYYLLKLRESLDFSEINVYKVLAEKTKEILKNNRKIKACARILKIKSGVFLMNMKENNKEMLQEMILLRKAEDLILEEFKVLQITLINEDEEFYGIDSTLLRKN